MGHPQLCYALLQAQMILNLDLEPILPPNAEEAQQLKMQASSRPMMSQQGVLPGLNSIGPRPLLPLLGILGAPGLGSLPLGTLPPSLPPMGTVPKASASMSPISGHGLAAKARPQQMPAPLQPGMVSSQSMDVG